MNSLESSRVLAVLQESVEALRLLSYVSYDVVASASQLDGVLGEDVVEALSRHREELEAAPEGFHPDHLRSTTLTLLRTLKKSPGSELRLASLSPERSPAILSLLHYFERLQQLVALRLGTTVEEDASHRDTHQQLKERQERAAAERQQLEHKLKLQRLERAKQTDLVQTAYASLSSQLAQLRIDASAGKAANAATAGAAAAADQEDYKARHGHVSSELAAVRAELEAVREEVRVGGAAAHKARKRAAADCEAAVQEYDSALTAKEQQHREARAALQKLQQDIEAALAETERLKKERLAHEEQLRLAAEAAKREELRQIRLEAAAYLIQNTWKCWRKFRAAEAKKAAGGAAGGGKGGAKGGREAGGAAGKGKTRSAKSKK